MERELTEDEAICRAESEIVREGQYLRKNLRYVPKQTQRAEEFHKEAKRAETHDRNYKAAAELYVRAAREGYNYLRIA